MLRVQTPHVCFGERIVGGETGVEHAAEIGIHTGTVLVPERVAQWMKRSELARHERQGETQYLGTAFLVLQVAHFVLDHLSGPAVTDRILPNSRTVLCHSHETAGTA